MLTKLEYCHTLFLIVLKSVIGGGGDGNIVKNDVGGEMVVVFTITETKYLVASLFFNLVRAISYLYLWY